MRKNPNKPDFLKGSGELRTKMVEKGLTYRDLQEKIKNDHGYTVTVSAISVILDDKLCEFVRDNAKIICSDSQ